MHVVGDKSKIQQVLYNLLDNAIKFSHNNSTITIETREKKNKLFVSVKDTGIGIPKEHQERIFERFYRVDKSHSKERGGTGLGLSIVKHGALLHGAKVSVESEEGRGTKISMQFPRICQK